MDILQPKQGKITLLYCTVDIINKITLTFPKHGVTNMSLATASWIINEHNTPTQIAIVLTQYTYSYTHTPQRTLYMYLHNTPLI